MLQWLRLAPMFALSMMEDYYVSPIRFSIFVVFFFSHIFIICVMKRRKTVETCSTHLHDAIFSSSAVHLLIARCAFFWGDGDGKKDEMGTVMTTVAVDAYDGLNNNVQFFVVVDKALYILC